MAGEPANAPPRNPEEPRPLPARSGRIGRQAERAPANPPKRKQVAQAEPLELEEGPIIGGQALRNLFARKNP
eukprot:3026518-Heterocapsa_arctica.AAC.1